MQKDTGAIRLILFVSNIKNVMYQMNWWLTASFDPSYEAKFVEKINRPYLKVTLLVSIVGLKFQEVEIRHTKK